MPKLEWWQARESNARAAAQRYAPKPNGSAVTYGLTASSLTMVGTFLAGGYFAVDVAAQGWGLAAMAFLAFAAGYTLRVWREAKHSHAVRLELSRRTPRSESLGRGTEGSEQVAAKLGTSETVTFKRPFVLPGLERPHSPGTFRLWERREPLDVSWDAFVVTKTIMLTEGGAVEALDVKADDLNDALWRDVQTSDDHP